MASLEFTGNTVNGDSVDIDMIQDWETLENTWYDENSDYYGEFSGQTVEFLNETYSLSDFRSEPGITPITFIDEDGDKVIIDKVISGNYEGMWYGIDLYDNDYRIYAIR